VKARYWISAGAALGVIGLLFWFTAWIAWPLAAANEAERPMSPDLTWWCPFWHHAKHV
jgi:hypothetical protein